MKLFEERFFSRVKKGASCWNWNGAKDLNGYGIFSHDGKNRRAHWMLLKRWPDRTKGEMACHHCDNPSCVNPEHIFIGTSKENHLDMMKKGRHPKNWFKLKENEIAQIRELYSIGIFSTLELGRMYKVNSTTIWFLVKGITRKFYDSPNQKRIIELQSELDKLKKYESVIFAETMAYSKEKIKMWKTKMVAGRAKQRQENKS